MPRRAAITLLLPIFGASADLLGAPYRNIRWLTRGIGSELLTNIGGRGGPPWQRSLDEHRSRRAPPKGVGNGSIAIVTGATGGIGAEVCRGLAHLQFHVVVAARDRTRGAALAASLQSAGGSAEFVELWVDSTESVRAFAAKMRGRPCALLINNAGLMSVAKGDIMRTNLIGPSLLTVALLPSLRLYAAAADGTSNDNLARASSGAAGRQLPLPRIVNVASSSHLRAGRVDPSLLENSRRDADLSAYAQSKLGLMQFSTLARASLPWLTIVDAHPGIVWTPMLQRHWGAKVAPLLERSRISRVLFKTPSSGANTILTAALSPKHPPPAWGERSRWRRGWEAGPYFVNRRPGGFASAESRDLEAAKATWRAMIEPLARDVAPEGCREVGAAIQSI